MALETPSAGLYFFQQNQKTLEGKKCTALNGKKSAKQFDGFPNI